MREGAVFFFFLWGFCLTVVGFKDFCIFNPTWGNDANLTHIIEMG